MNAVQEDVTKLVAKELKSANEQFPLFHSSHEGWAVIKEELEEVKTDLECAEIEVDTLWRLVKNNDSNTSEYVKSLRDYATSCAVECIQLAAMSQKYLDSNVK